MQLHFILNPNAGNGRGQKIWARFKQQLTLNYEMHERQLRKAGENHITITVSKKAWQLAK